MFAEGCQKGQMLTTFICFLIISWISPDRQTDEQINRQTDTNIYTINTVTHAQYYNYTSAGPQEAIVD